MVGNQREHQQGPSKLMSFPVCQALEEESFGIILRLKKIKTSVWGENTIHLQKMLSQYWIDFILCIHRENI